MECKQNMNVVRAQRKTQRGHRDKDMKGQRRAERPSWKETENTRRLICRFSPESNKQQLLLFDFSFLCCRKIRLACVSLEVLSRILIVRKNLVVLTALKETPVHQLV